MTFNLTNLNNYNKELLISQAADFIIKMTDGWTNIFVTDNNLMRIYTEKVAGDAVMEGHVRWQFRIEDLMTKLHRQIKANIPIINGKFVKPIYGSTIDGRLIKLDEDVFLNYIRLNRVVNTEDE